MDDDKSLAKTVVFCIPTITRPYQVMLDSLEASVPLLDSSGWTHYMVSEVGSPYISCARSIMLRKALDIKADVIIFLDHDLSFDPQDLLKLIETEGDVVAGTYRFKRDKVEYMGALQPDINGNPIVRKDGTVKGHWIPAGFLKITRNAVCRFIEAYPELTYGDKCAPHVDLFNHGAYKGVWYGEDYSFARRWRELGGDINIIPDINVNHHTAENEYKGNYHQYLMTMPGGSNDPDRAIND
jgi:glycosyltransferase involved in cell wall biosynthesis